MQQRIDWLPLRDLEQRLDAYAQSTQPQVRSVLAMHKGAVLLERYWAGFSQHSYHCLNSITKSVVSAIVGLALADGYLALSDPLPRWFPNLHAHPHAHAANVTVRDLLTMTAGFNRRIPTRGGYMKAADPIAALLTRRTDFAP